MFNEKLLKIGLSKGMVNDMGFTLEAIETLKEDPFSMVKMPVTSQTGFDYNFLCFIILYHNILSLKQSIILQYTMVINLE